MRAGPLDGRNRLGRLPTVGILLVMGGVMGPASLWVFSLAENRAKRLGLLKRSG